jgi:uroporphyrinogen decarboxylase
MTTLGTDERLLVRALRREPLSRTPVWLMRQAGRYLPEYRAVRERAGGFLQMVRDPELAAEVTLQPVRRFEMDAAIVFSDILMPLQAMGMPLVFDEGGPVLPAPLCEREHVEALKPLVPSESLAYVGETLRLVRRELPDETALIGFCGAPFTLASYAVEGGAARSFARLRSMMYRESATFELLMDRLAEAAAVHLRYQAERGCDVLILFDTWAGSLGREDWLRYAAPWTRRVLAQTAGIAPRIVFAGHSDHLLEDLAALGAEGIGLDHRTDLPGAFERTGGKVAIQGNLDPAALLAEPEEVARRTHALLDAVGGRPGHVLNLGHGVLKETDPECVAAFVAAAKERER